MAIVRQLIERHDCMAIALVDHAVLLNQTTGPYVGHYIVLAGIDTTHDTDEDDTLVVYNPAMDTVLTQISLDTFERAWRAQGTDEDIVFVFSTE